MSEQTSVCSDKITGFENYICVILINIILTACLCIAHHRREHEETVAALQKQHEEETQSLHQRLRQLEAAGKQTAKQGANVQRYDWLLLVM